MPNYYTKYILLARCLFLIIILGVLPTSNVFSQSPEFKNYTVKDGLPSSEIYNSIQDSKGFLWFATDKGVSRFDGYGFTTFNTSNGLADNTVFECQEDFKGRIWFRSFSGKLSYYYHDSIYKLAINDSLSKLIKESFVQSISIDTMDNLYMGLTNFNKGIIKVSLKNINSFSVVSVPPEIYYIILPSGGKPLTGGTRSRLLEPGPLKKQHIHLFTLDPKTQSLKKIKTFDQELLGTTQNHDKAIMLEGGKIATSYNSNFIIIDTNSKKFVLVKDLKNRFIANICMGNSNNIWISTPNTISYFSHGAFIDRYSPTFLSEKSVTSVTEDKEGGTWFTTLYGGIYYTTSLSFKTYSPSNGLTGTKISAFAVTPNGTMWVAAYHSNK